MPQDMVADILNMKQDYTRSMFLPRRSKLKATPIIYIKWEPLDQGWLTLNVDEAVWKNSPNRGGVIRDRSSN